MNHIYQQVIQASYGSPALSPGVYQDGCPQSISLCFAAPQTVVLCERFDRHKWNAQCSSAEMDTLTDIHTLHLHLHVHLHFHLHLDTFTLHTCIHACIHAYMHTSIQTCIYIYNYIYM